MIGHPTVLAMKRNERWLVFQYSPLWGHCVIHFGLVWRVCVSQRRAKVPVDLELNINTLCICTKGAKYWNTTFPTVFLKHKRSMMLPDWKFPDLNMSMSVHKCVWPVKKKWRALAASVFSLWIDQTQGYSATADNPHCACMQCRPYCPFLTILFAKCFSNGLLMLLRNHYLMGIYWFWKIKLLMFVLNSNICW